MKDNKLFDKYAAYELLYETNMKKENKPIFPSDWYDIVNYQTKIDILLEALDNNKLIIETKKYKKIQRWRW